MNNKKHLTNVLIERLISAVKNGKDIIAVVADSTSTAKINDFMKLYPDRVVNVGIAEQTMVGSAAGLALAGKIPVTCNAAPFLISRANEQIKVDICYNNTNVKLMGLNSGASYGPLASTHHCIDDISIMRGFGNIEIYAPSCPEECEQIIDYVLEHNGPVYVRLDGKELPYLHDKNYQFKPGNIDVLKRGKQIALVSTGSTVYEIVEAEKLLSKRGIFVSVINLSSIRPCNKTHLISELSHMNHIITVEEHNINGGVGSLVCEVLSEIGIGIPVHRLGIPDGQYALAADRSSLRNYHGLDANSICHLVEKLIKE